MLTQIANIVILSSDIMYFCYKLQKKHNLICVFATKNLCGTQSYNEEKSPADSLCGGLLYYIIYSVYIFGRESLISTVALTYAARSSALSIPDRARSQWVLP